MTNLKENSYPDQQFLHEYFEYRDGGLYWIKSYARSIVIGKRLGFIFTGHNSRRWKCEINGFGCFLSRLIFLYHHGWLPENVDHWDRDTLNDKIENLRAATFGENSRNSSSHKNSYSQYKGVTFRKNKNIWPSRINFNNKTIYIGEYKTEIEAALAYNREAVRYHKEFANLNIIQPKTPI